MGFGLIAIEKGNARLIEMGTIKLPRDDSHALKLKSIFEQTLILIEKHLPDEFAIEAPFFGKNVQSMLKLGRAQGVAMSAALSRQIPIHEYSPRKIKQSITGNGNSSKEQVAEMLRRLLLFKDIPEYLDATDGLAVAMCHHFQKKPGPLNISGKKGGGWAAFINANPDRKL